MIYGLAVKESDFLLSTSLYLFIYAGKLSTVKSDASLFVLIS